MYLSHNASLVTTHVLQEMKNKGEKIAMLTAYDYTMAKILDQANIDVILVGDSASNVMEGHPTTLPITLDEMIIYGASVVRAVSHAMAKGYRLCRRSRRSGDLFVKSADPLRCSVRWSRHWERGS